MSHQHRARPSRWRHLLGALGDVVLALLALDDAEAGDVGAAVVEATFTGDVAATDYSAGVTIKVNAIAANIVSALRQDDHSLVHFTLDTAIDIDDTITWEYDDDFGDYEDSEGAPMGDIAATAATNYIGSHLRWNLADDSAWVSAL